MASLNQIANRVANLLKQPFNHELKERIKDSFKSIYAERLRQRIDKQSVKDTYKTFFDAKLIKVDKADTCAATLGCTILRTENKIPSLVDYRGDTPFIFVGTMDGATFVPSNRAMLRSIKSLEFIGNAVYYFYENGYIYIWNNTLLKWLRIGGVFPNLEAAITICDDSTRCYDDDMEFPAPEDMINSIIYEMLKMEFGIINVEPIEIKLDEEVQKGK